MGCGATTSAKYAVSLDTEDERIPKEPASAPSRPPHQGSGPGAKEPTLHPPDSHGAGSAGRHHPDPGAGSRGSGRHPSTGTGDASTTTWLFEDEPGIWAPLSVEACQKIELAQSMALKSLVYCHRGDPYAIDLAGMVMSNWNTGCKKKLKVGTTAPSSHRAGAPPKGPPIFDPQGHGAGPGGHRPAAPSKTSGDGDKRGPPSHKAPEAARRGGEWQWEESADVWKSFDPEVAQLLRAGRSMGRDRVVYMLGKDSYEANLDTCIQKNLRTGFSRKIRWAGRQRQQMQFQWQLKNHTWVDYDEEENEKLCDAKNAGAKSASYSARGFEYRVDFVNMTQENMSTNAGSCRKVRIVGIDSTRVDPGPRTVRPPAGAVPEAAPKAPGEKRFSFHSPRDSSSPRGAPQSATFDKAYSTFSDPSGKTHKSHEGRHGGAAHSSGGAHASSTAGGSSSGHKSSHASSHGPSSGKSSASGSSKHDGPSHAAGPGKYHSGIKLPRGVDWPEDPKAMEAAAELFTELSKVPINERKKAFMKGCLRWHPDKNPDDEDTATEVFQFLQALKDWYLGD